eukprot:c10765_g1_i3.p1 GENE.c10765_g1_i3~~c10765_g1_i3.p1  ORF type:complete len:337 (+),score=57.96 c10765_g1_i3:115-1011(+)
MWHPKINYSSLVGKTCVVTGATAGVGKEVARALAFNGAHVIMAVRNVELGQELVEKWTKEAAGRSIKVDVLPLDLSRVFSVATFANELIKQNVKIACLINNAGLFNIHDSKRYETEYELHWGVNFLGHFYLVAKLWPLIIRHRTPCTIINLSSTLHWCASIDLHDLNLTRNYTPIRAYSNSKLAMILFASELNRRATKFPFVRSFSAHPGTVFTDILRGHGFVQFLYRRIAKFFLMSGTQAAEVILHVATEAERLKPGTCFANCKPMWCSRQAKDPKLAREIWQSACDSLHLNDDWAS